jgi:hypothetical protein
LAKEGFTIVTQNNEGAPDLSGTPDGVHQYRLQLLVRGATPVERSYSGGQMALVSNLKDAMDIRERVQRELDFAGFAAIVSITAYRKQDEYIFKLGTVDMSGRVRPGTASDRKGRR